MRLICKEHYKCTSGVTFHKHGCSHSVSHEMNSSCVDVKSSCCYCSSITKLRKNKLNEIESR